MIRRGVVALAVACLIVASLGWAGLAGEGAGKGEPAQGVTLTWDWMPTGNTPSTVGYLPNRATPGCGGNCGAFDVLAPGTETVMVHVFVASTFTSAQWNGQNGYRVVYEDEVGGGVAEPRNYAQGSISNAPIDSIHLVITYGSVSPSPSPIVESTRPPAIPRPTSILPPAISHPSLAPTHVPTPVQAGATSTSAATPSPTPTCPNAFQIAGGITLCSHGPDPGPITATATPTPGSVSGTLTAGGGQHPGHAKSRWPWYLVLGVVLVATLGVIRRRGRRSRG